jgi:3-polyprenyl-4-hydroxybenzoate decarboxylase
MTKKLEKPLFVGISVALSEMVDHPLGRRLDLFGIDVGTVNRWIGITEQR